MGRPPLEDIQMIKDMGHTLSTDPLTGQMPVVPLGSIPEMPSPAAAGQISFVSIKKNG
jgi:hypothetical protein